MYSMGKLLVQNVSCGYDGRVVLKEVSFEISSGEIIAFIGPNGSGKSTLFKTLDRLLKPLAGNVYLDGRDIWKLHEREVAKQIAFVCQSAHVSWPFTVRQAVTMGRFSHRGWVAAYTAEDSRVVDESLEAAGLSDIGERSIDTLSGGELQRVMIARALAQEPSVILLDEPVSNLDIKYQVTVLELVRSMAHNGMAVGVILHDLNLASLYADRIGLLSNGELAALGEPSQILSKENIDAAYDTDVFVREHPLHPRPQVIYIPSWMKQEKE